MAAKELSLFQQACGKLRISRLGPLTMLVVDGQGLGLCMTGDFSPVQKWAQAKKAGPNATIDMGKIIEKIDVIVCRAGTTFASTRGSTKPLEGIAKAMRAAGMDLKEFSLPPEIREMEKAVDHVLAAKAAGEKKKAAEAALNAAPTENKDPPS
ncbi:MAG: hypothetical protein ACRETF_08225 [Nevskiaceae bacterium]